jgi:hypothetical protein
MFRLRKSRRRSRSGEALRKRRSSTSIRLGVELMEGRMMLAASVLDAPQVGSDIGDYVIPAAQINAAGSYQIQMLYGIQAADVGYLQFDSVSGVADSVSWNLLSPRQAEHSTSVAGLITRDFDFPRAIGVDHDGTYQNWSDNVSFGDGSVLKAVAILPTWNTLGAPTAAIIPIVVGPSQTGPNVSEGGAIPIHPIFADFRKDSHLASGVKPASPAAETTVASLTAARSAATADGAIAGEWARATVFEIAGGEPTTSDSQRDQPAATSGTDQALQDTKPLSSVKTLQQNERLASRNAAETQSDGSPASPGQTHSAQDYGQPSSDLSALLANGKLTSDAAGPHFNFNTLGSNNLKISTVAAAAVFDQLGEGNTAVIESTTDGKSWLRSIGTSPLLMVLALERIAAFNSRRATRESRVAAAKNPLRLRF